MRVHKTVLRKQIKKRIWKSECTFFLPILGYSNSQFLPFKRELIRPPFCFLQKLLSSVGGA
jgi:hypothetical protein